MSMTNPVDQQLMEEEFVPIEKKMQCLQTGIYDVVKRAPFLGTVLQCLDIFYSHQIPRAGIMFNANGKKWEMAINPKWFCDKLTGPQREAILLHEIYHVTHKHPMRIPFLKISPDRRQLMNVAMDMVINQYIQNLPKGCKDCPPVEKQFEGEVCTNKLCPGGCIDIVDYYDTDKNKNKIPWAKEKTTEFYYHKLVEKFMEPDKGREPSMFEVEHVFEDPLDIMATNLREQKRVVSTNPETLTTHRAELKIGQLIALVAQTDPKDNGVYEILDLGSDKTQFELKRTPGHSGTVASPVYIGDMAVYKHQKITRAKGPVAWVVIGTQRAADSNLVNVDTSPLIFQEQPIQVKGNGPGEFDSHHWDGNAEETEMMDATEELVKRAMQKRNLSYDKLPGHVRELLKDIDARRQELNYKQLILSAIKRRASGQNREQTWMRKSRRFGNKAPGSHNGKLPHLVNLMDTSGSISVEEANEMLSIIDEFLRVGSRKCDVGLWHTNLYYFEKYKLGDRFDKSQFQSGGTDLTATFKKIHEIQSDLAIILTDGCYSDVDVESWLKPGEQFPQVLFIITKDGTANHPFKDRPWQETIQIPKVDMNKGDKI
jgi:predicted metal-dependent peptidase